MKTLYYELSPVLAETWNLPQYLSYSDSMKSSGWGNGPQRLAYGSTRIWELNNGKVQYLKNRNGERHHVSVDSAEFFLVQLKAVPYQHESLL